MEPEIDYIVICDQCSHEWETTGNENGPAENVCDQCGSEDVGWFVKPSEED